MYQQIQGLNTEEKGLEISNFLKRKFNESQTALSDTNMQNQFNKMSVLNVKQFQKILFFKQFQKELSSTS
jgi:uncharacterized protein